MKAKAIALMLFILAPAALFCQASRFPQIARLLAKDGYDARQAAAVAKIKKDSMELNRRGYAAYEKKDFLGAAELFKQALTADDGNAFAAYNLACSLSLALGNRGFDASEEGEVVKTILRNLIHAAGFDVHWIYNIFLDPDLDPVRGSFILTTAFFPCPGDACPDRYYFFREDGTVGYAAAPTDLVGEDGSRPEPKPGALGWYVAIGDYLLAYIPGANALSPQMYPPSIDENGQPLIPPDGIESFLVKTNSDGGPDVTNDEGLWE